MVHVSCILSLSQLEKVYQNSIDVQVFVVKYCTLDSQRTATYFDAQTVGKQLLQNHQYVRTILAAKYVKSLVIYRDRKNVHTMKSRSISLHSADHKTFCLIFTRANCISTASNINPPNMRFNIPKRFAGCGDLDVASKITAAEDALSAMRLEKKIKTNEQ